MQQAYVRCTHALTAFSESVKNMNMPQAIEIAPIMINWYLHDCREPCMCPIPNARRPPNAFARPRKVDQYPIRMGCSSILYHIAVIKRYAGVEQDSSAPRTKRSAANEGNVGQPPRAMVTPPQMMIFPASHLDTETFCIAKLVGYSNCIIQHKLKSL